MKIWIEQVFRKSFTFDKFIINFYVALSLYGTHQGAALVRNWLVLINILHYKFIYIYTHTVTTPIEENNPNVDIQSFLDKMNRKSKFFNFEFYFNDQTKTRTQNKLQFNHQQTVWLTASDLAAHFFSSRLQQI